MKHLLLLLSGIFGLAASAQSSWPSQSWTGATNLTPAMSVAGVIELSGLHWNPENQRLYAVANDGRLRVLQFDAESGSYSQIANKALNGGPEGITQADYAENAFYTIDESSYEIRKYNYNSSFTTVSESRHWDLLAAPSPMDDTGNTGPEGIVFIADSFLSEAGFVSSETGSAYTSTKGMGGLMFVAHQDGGYVWVFDLNPSVNDDFLFVGKYKTSYDESCELSFDRSTGLMYVLHNTAANYLEVTDLSLVAGAAEPTFTPVSLYFIGNPPGSNTNVEGFALSPKCSGSQSYAWLCRDASSSESSAVKQDVLRWFDPFTASGNCDLAVAGNDAARFAIAPNPCGGLLHIKAEETVVEARICDLLGQTLLKAEGPLDSIDVRQLASGSYLLSLKTVSGSTTLQFLKR